MRVSGHIDKTNEECNQSRSQYGFHLLFLFFTNKADVQRSPSTRDEHKFCKETHLFSSGAMTAINGKRLQIRSSNRMTACLFTAHFACLLNTNKKTAQTERLVAKFCHQKTYSVDAISANCYSCFNDSFVHTVFM